MLIFYGTGTYLKTFYLYVLCDLSLHFHRGSRLTSLRFFPGKSKLNFFYFFISFSLPFNKVFLNPSKKPKTLFYFGARQMGVGLGCLTKYKIFVRKSCIEYRIRIAVLFAFLTFRCLSRSGVSRIYCSQRASYVTCSNLSNHRCLQECVINVCEIVVMCSPKWTLGNQE